MFALIEFFADVRERIGENWPRSTLLKGKSLKVGSAAGIPEYTASILGKLQKPAKVPFRTLLAAAQGLNRIPPDVMLVARYEFGLQAKK